MQIGFEVTSARPKGLPADDQPVQVPMRPAAEIRRSPSTDQKKVRRAQQRKTASMEFIAALNDVGDCRICGGDLKTQESNKGDSTVRATCSDCGTEHHLQSSDMERSAALVELDGLDDKTLRRLANVDTWLHIEKMPCPDCTSQGFGTKRMGGHSQDGDGKGFKWHVLCKDCGHHYKVSDQDAAESRRKTASTIVQAYTWVPTLSTAQYTGGNPLSAIARRAQQVSSIPEENL